MKGDILDQIAETFASKPGKSVGETTDSSANEAVKTKKGLELKVLDAKSAQNLCKFCV